MARKLLVVWGARRAPPLPLALSIPSVQPHDRSLRVVVAFSEGGRIARHAVLRRARKRGMVGGAHRAPGHHSRDGRVAGPPPRLVNPPPNSLENPNSLALIVDDFFPGGVLEPFSPNSQAVIVKGFLGAVGRNDRPNGFLPLSYES